MRHWTEEEKQRQRELIRRWQPWKKSTGAKTDAGKAKSRMNALKHGGHTKEMQVYRLYLRHTKAVLRDVQALLRKPRELPTDNVAKHATPRPVFAAGRNSGLAKQSSPSAHFVDAKEHDRFRRCDKTAS